LYDIEIGERNQRAGQSGEHTGSDNVMSSNEGAVMDYPQFATCFRRVPIDAQPALILAIFPVIDGNNCVAVRVGWATFNNRYASYIVFAPPPEISPPQ
jgi:hypothetical protein